MAGLSEVTLDDLPGVIANSKWRILAAAVAGAVIGLGIWLIGDPQYQASVTVAPVAEQASGHGGGLASLATQYGDLAQMAGLSPAGGGTEKAESVAVLQSELLTERYIKQNNLLPILFQKKWDGKKGAWRVTDPKDIPTLWKANQLFRSKIRNVSEDRKTGLVVMTLKWKDATLAATWANGLVALTNEYLRGLAIEEAERNIAYLNDQASRTNVVETRHALFELLQEQINTEMIAKGRRDYALKVIDPAVAPEKPSSLGVGILVSGGALAGAIVGAVLVLMRRNVMRSD